jgi:hypothetical protein
MIETRTVEGSAPVPRSGAGGSAVSDIEQLIGVLSKESLGGFRTTEFYVVILTWLLLLSTLIWHRDFSSLVVPIATLAAGIASAAYAISRAITKSGRAKAVAAIMANQAGALTGVTARAESATAQAESLATDIQALRTALNQLPSAGTSSHLDVAGEPSFAWEEGHRPPPQ